MQSPSEAWQSLEECFEARASGQLTLRKELSALTWKDGEDPFFLLSDIERIAAELGAHSEPMDESTIRSLFIGALAESHYVEVSLLEDSVRYSRGELE